MYCALNEKKDIIAIHDSKKVIEKYIYNIKRTNQDTNLTIGKIKDKNLKNIHGLDELYLVRFNSTYIQEKYIDYIKLMSDQYLEDYIYVLDILKRIVEIEDVDEKDIKNLLKSISIIEDLIEDDKKYTPDIQCLENVKNTFEPYINMWN